MTNLQFEDNAAITGMRRTQDGFLVGEVRCARTGCQTYHSSEIGVGDGALTVYRPEEAVFAKDSLATYAGKPVTIGHPDKPVTSENWKELAVGDVGSDIARDGEFVSVPIKLMDAAAIKVVEDGTREISMGYTTPIDLRDGVAPDGTPYQAIQTGPIRINHLAIVDKARGGSKLRIGDGANKWGAAPITTADIKGGNMPDNLRKIVVDGLSVTTTDEGAQAIEKLQNAAAEAKDAHDAELATVNSDLADANKAVETKDGEITALKKQLADATSPQAIADAAKKRADNLAKGKKAGLSEEELEKMDDAAIRKAVVSKSLGDSAKDMSDAEVEGAFKALTASDTAAHRVDDTLRGGIQTQVDDAWAFLDEKKKGA